MTECVPDECRKPSSGVVCASGQLTDYCDYEYCNNEYCEDIGHCSCRCHAGTVCRCGFQFGESG